MRVCHVAGIRLVPTGRDELLGLGERLRRAITLGAAVTLGFIVVFGGTGLVLATGGRVILRTLPWAGLLVGIVLVVLGLAFLTGKGPLIHLPAVAQGSWPRGVRARFVFGIGYAAASLGCTLPIFLALLPSALATEGAASAGGAFVAYALGMGLILTAVALGAVLVRGAVARRLRRAGQYLERASALLLVAAGAYLVSGIELIEIVRVSTWLRGRCSTAANGVRCGSASRFRSLSRRTAGARPTRGATAPARSAPCRATSAGPPR